MKLLSIVIPSYNRPNELKMALESLSDQIISLNYQNTIEIIVQDDCSTDSNTEKVIQELQSKHSFIFYRLNHKNIGLEKNLIHSTRSATGKYLWIFGNDDYLEKPYSLKKITDELIKGNYSFLVLNRTRRNFKLDKVITDNWMRIDVNKDIIYSGLNEFCLRWGLISVIGFISVNIFDRIKFLNVNDFKYYGIMYPQLGMMYEAFYNEPVLLIGEPLLCHRTQSRDEKKKSLGNKLTEAKFMTNEEIRNANYFSYNLISFLLELERVGSTSFEEINTIPEWTVINGLLIDFIINNLLLSDKHDLKWSDEMKQKAVYFFDQIELTQLQKDKITDVIC